MSRMLRNQLKSFGNLIDMLHALCVLVQETDVNWFIKMYFRLLSIVEIMKDVFGKKVYLS